MHSGGSAEELISIMADECDDAFLPSAGNTALASEESISIAEEEQTALQTLYNVQELAYENQFFH